MPRLTQRIQSAPASQGGESPPLSSAHTPWQPYLLLSLLRLFQSFFAHACARDDQCRLSCTYGAVTNLWYDLADRRRDECRDGCSAKGMSVRCEDGRCLALRNGEPYLGCTARSIWRDD